MDKETWKALPENWKAGVRKYAGFKGEPKPAHLKKIAALEKLFITVGSTGLEPLAHFTGVKFFGIYDATESLDLSHTGVVDLSPVKKMKKLRRLYLEGMDVSGSAAPRKIQAQIEAFEKSRPGLYISTAD